MYKIQIVKKCIQALLSRVYDQIELIQAKRKLPEFVLNSLNKSVQQVQNLGQINKQIQKRVNKNQVTEIKDQTALKIDNFAIGKCKSVYRENLSNSNKTKSKSDRKLLRNISFGSQNIHSTRSFHNGQTSFNSNINTSRIQNVNDAHKSVKGANKFIKLFPQNQEQLKQHTFETKLRQQLQKKRQKKQNQQNNSKIVAIKLFQRQKKLGSKINQLKYFTFNYDSTVLKSNLSSNLGNKDFVFIQESEKNKSNSSFLINKDQNSHVGNMIQLKQIQLVSYSIQEVLFELIKQAIILLSSAEDHLPRSFKQVRDFLSK